MALAQRLSLGLTEFAKLTHVLASEAAQIGGVGATAQVDVDLPRPLADIELAPIPTLEEGADVTEPALLQNVAAGPEGIAAITSSVAAPSPEADGTFSQREEVAAEEADLAGNASKKARVE